MGSFKYDGVIVHVDDRTLTHLQIVIYNKLRKGESFPMSWKDSTATGSGRSSIWLSPNSLLHFKFDGGRTPLINREWLARLQESADSSKGLIVTAEDGELTDMQHSAFKETVAEIGVTQQM